jgi:hypothetical protein
METSMIIGENGEDCPVLVSRTPQQSQQSENQKQSFERGELAEMKYYFRLQSWWSYHWKYRDGNQEYRYELTCPTQVKNVKMYHQNQLVAQSEAQIFQLSDREKYHIYDCHGNQIFVISTGGFFGKILAPQDYLLEDQDGNVLSFIKTSNLINSLANYEVTNPNGEIIGRVKRFLYRNNFEISIIKPNDPGVDLRALGLLFSQKSFRGFGPKQQDYCNVIGTNSVVGIFLVIILILGFFVRYLNNRRSS